jgi:hypothetical protein
LIEGGLMNIASLRVPWAPSVRESGCPGNQEIGMATTAKDDALLKAADLTARQLQQAIEIVESNVGKERAESDGALIGAVLEVLATNYRHATR